MGKLADLLNYKASVVLRDERKNEDLYEVWVRLLGEEDLKEAFKFARIASAKKRALLNDKNSSDAQDDLAQLSEQPIPDLIDIIVAARENIFNNEASVVVDREDLPEISSIAKHPDAPTLPEQEKLDKLIAEQEADYAKRVEEYISTKVAETREELSKKKPKEIHEIASEELVNIQSLQEFLDELNDQKIFRGTYDDKDCKVRSFDTIEECKGANISIRQQLLAAYNALEVNGDDIKN